MSKDWVKRIDEIEQRFKTEGFGDFMSWPVLNATMIIAKNEPVVDRAIQSMVKEPVSPTVAYQLFHTKQWLDLGNKVSRIEIVCEIGGGFGAMHHAWRLLGFRGIWFTIDHPVMVNLQKHYSKLVGIPEPIELTSVPNCDMLIACFSLSEMDIEEREKVMNDAVLDHHLVVYAKTWDGIDNEKYFDNWSGTTIPHTGFKTVYYNVL